MAGVRPPQESDGTGGQTRADAAVVPPRSPSRRRVTRPWTTARLRPVPPTRVPPRVGPYRLGPARRARCTDADPRQSSMRFSGPERELRACSRGPPADRGDPDALIQSAPGLEPLVHVNNAVYADWLDEAVLSAGGTEPVRAIRVSRVSNVRAAEPEVPSRSRSGPLPTAGRVASPRRTRTAMPSTMISPTGAAPTRTPRRGGRPGTSGDDPDLPDWRNHQRDHRPGRDPDASRASLLWPSSRQRLSRRRPRPSSERWSPKPGSAPGASRAGRMVRAGVRGPRRRRRAGRGDARALDPSGGRARDRRLRPGAVGRSTRPQRR